MDVLSCNDLTVKLSDRVILENVSFEAQCGNVYVLLGSNGTGKTTLLRTISGLVKPAKGNISVNGKDTHDFTRKEYAKKICYLPQNHSAVFDYPVVDFVILGRTAHGNIFYQPTKADTEKAMEILAQTGIGHLAHRPYTNLSSGECQLVMLARALMQDTPFLLLDEPTSNLDFTNQKMVMEKITTLAHEQNKAIIISIHDPNAAVEYCDYILAVNNKKIIAELCKKHKDFNSQIEAVMKQIYDSSVKVMQIDDYIVVR